MKNFYSTLLLLALALPGFGADSPIGNKPVVTSLSESNYVAAVTGSGATAVFRLISPANLRGGSISVLDYGADKTGAADSTLAFRNAMTNAGASVYIPVGTYILTNVFPTNVSVYGDGIGRTVLRFNTNAVPFGYMFDMVRNRSHWRDLTFDGGSTTNLKGFATSDEARSGLRLWADGANTIDACEFIGWHSNGVYMAGTDSVGNRPNRALVTGSHFTNCWRGLWMADTNMAEYCSVISSQFRNCETGLKNDSANVTVGLNQFIDAAVVAYPLNGRSHSRYFGNSFNHGGLSFQNALSGANVNGNDFLGSPSIYLLSPCFGVSFTGCLFENVTVTDYSGGTNWFFGNNVLTALSPDGGTSRSIYENNRMTTGAKLNDTVALAYVTTNLHLLANKGNEFGIVLTQNSGVTIAGGGDGQLVRLRLTQDATGSRTCVFTNLFKFGTDVPLPTLTTTAGKTDVIEARYWSASNRWDVLRVVKGY